MDAVGVSAVIPAYNSARFISATIESALAQTLPLFEIIVVDDGSTDETAEVAARFPNTRIIRRENGGQGAARNTGIQAARGEWIALLDHDDTWNPRKTEIQLRYALPGVGVIHGNSCNDVTVESLWQRKASITPSGALVRRQTLLEVGGFNESRDVMGVEDLNLWLRIALTDWRFVGSEVDLFVWQRGNNQSANEMRMARAELANVERIGALANRPGAELEAWKGKIRLEYARNLVGQGRMREACELLDECVPGIASRWLQFAARFRMKRLARTDILGWLVAMEGRNRGAY